MVLKTFNIEEAVYAKFSTMCKEYGISMSKQVETFMRTMTEQEPKARKDYLARLDVIRKGKFIPVKSLAEKYKF